MTMFCLACGLPLDPKFRKYNRRFKGPDGPYRKYCNDECAGRDHKKSPREIPKHGVAAW